MNLSLAALFWPVTWDRQQATIANGIAGWPCVYMRNPSQVVLGDWATMDMWVSGLRAASIWPCFTIDPALPDVVALTQQAVARYRWKINVWEIGNEVENFDKPWWNNTAALISLHNAIYSTLKTAAPEAAISIGSMQAWKTGGQAPRMLGRMLDAGCKTDFINVHLYPTSSATAVAEIAQMVADAKAVARLYGLGWAKVWATEVGVLWTRFAAQTQAVQAMWAAKLLGACKAAGVESASFYSWDQPDSGFKAAGDTAVWKAVAGELA